MKKFILLILAFVVVGFLAYKLLLDKPVKPIEIKEHPLTIGKNSTQFDTAFAGLLRTLKSRISSMSRSA